MAARIEPAEFSRVYRRSVIDVMRFVTFDGQASFARHDLSLHPERFDLRTYLEASERRYLNLVELYNELGAHRVSKLRALDVGGFMGAYPLALARLGVDITLAEQYGYYYGALDELAAYLAAEGVQIWDVDFTGEVADRREPFTLVSNMAMLEHLASSPKALMDNIRSSIEPRGLLVLEIPNVAYWPNRLEALRGQSIHQPLELVYESEPPYLGHHREYTAGEVGDVLRWSGFRLERLAFFNYSLSLRRGSWFDRLYTLLVYLWPTLLFPRCREVIMAAAAPVAPAAPDLA